MKFYVLLLSLCFAVGFASCGDDDNNCSGTDYTAEVSAQSDKMSAAATVYSNDPTNENCVAYEAEIDALIAVYAEYQDCSLLNVGGAIDTAIESLETSKATLNCN